MENVRLSDRFDLACSTALLNGTQALVRLMLTQREIDRRRGLNTAGYVTGYRGSPLGAVDMQMSQAKHLLDDSDIIFHPALNEDLAATALWGTQQAELRGEGNKDGVFGLWYGKGPGVDRSGDVLRHANFAGTSRFGGVLMALGDDHTGESSTTLHQSEWTLVDSYIPILSPAGVQEIIEFGIFGYALSRYSGNWVGIKCMKETIEATSVIYNRFNEFDFSNPIAKLPKGGLNIRLVDSPREQEERTFRFKRQAAELFAEANQIDRRMHGKPGAKIGIVAAGKNWLDLVHALELMGIDHDEAEKLGITTYKVGMTWPLAGAGFREWASDTDLIVVIEEKRKLIEPQIKELLFNDQNKPRVFGHFAGDGSELFQINYALDPVNVAQKIGKVLIAEGRSTDRIKAGLSRLEGIFARRNEEDIAVRNPYFCSGCPHNSSTKIPKGSRAYAGIGCHYMVQWMDRETIGFTHMGGEGANWIGESQFSKRQHVFQNIGDGTYNHSGIMAIRAAVAANTNVTFKLLFNDAVAMTGGQKNDGGLTAARVANELVAIGVSKVALVYDPNEDIDLATFPTSVERHERSQLDNVQRAFRDVSGVTAIIYVQTCAAEKRRRRKRGSMTEQNQRIYINTDVCEGCGDCGVQSNCVSIVPVETKFGRKRAIDQSSCNKDFSCLNGFCPSFVTLTSAKVKSATQTQYTIPSLPLPQIPAICRTHNIVITGVGGTGVVTVGAVLAMAAHLDGKGAGMIEMAGLAQKGGAVNIHCRIANCPEDISAIRVAASEADCLIGGDIVVSAVADVLNLVAAGRTFAVVNSHEIITGEFTRDIAFRLPMDRLQQRILSELGADKSLVFNASELSRKMLGDSIFSNTILMGAAWQRGALPLSLEAMETAIKLNGAAVAKNISAFSIGRWLVVDAEGLSKKLKPAAAAENAKALSDLDVRKQHLLEHSNLATVQRYQSLVQRFSNSALCQAVALGYHKLLAVKDEYEVARLHLQTVKKAQLEFEDGFSLRFHLAPPLLPGRDTDGRPRKREFGMWMLKVFTVLAKLKSLRGTAFDPFGYTKERRLQREFTLQYEQDMEMLLAEPAFQSTSSALELARLPLTVRGYGPVWLASFESAMARREELLNSLGDINRNN